MGHLQRLVPGSWNWDVEVYDLNEWVVSFPSKAELHRSINFGTADLKNNLFLKFEEFNEDENFGHELPSIWMRVTNLPRVFRKYNTLWAIGSLFGATQKVDMITSKKHRVGRFQVGVLNVDLVPTQMDVVIGDRYLELEFVIEKEPAGNHAPTKSQTEVDVELDGQPIDGQNNGADKAPFLQANDSREGSIKEVVSGGTSEPLVEDGHMFDMEEDDLLEETETGAKTPLLDNSGEALSSPMGTPLCIASEALEVAKEVQIDESQRETATATVLDQLRTPPLGPLLDKALEKASQGAAGTSTPQRRSSRAAATADEDSVEKAVKLAAKRNLEQTSGTLSQNSVLMFSDSMINNNLRCLGINLGKTDEARVRSINLVKTSEVNGSHLISHQKDHSLDNEGNEIESDVDISDLNVFCGVEGVDVVGDYSDDVSVHSQAAPHHTTEHKKNASMPKKGKKRGSTSQKNLFPNERNFLEQ